MKLEKARILLIGAGEVGRRKAVDLLECKPAHLLWIDPGLSFAEVRTYLPESVLDSVSLEEPGNGGLPESALSCLRYEQRGAGVEDLNGRNLVFTATSSRKVNAMVAAQCHERGILCNVADDPDGSDFYVPAHFSQGDIVLALSTGGQSPALARRLRLEVQEWMGERYCVLLKVLGRIRPLVQGLGLPSAENCTIFRELSNSDLPRALADGDMDASRAILLKVLPASLHEHMREILYGSV